MRITVALVVNLVANGMSTDEISREYPDLEPDDVRQALSYASALANEEVHLFTKPSGVTFLADMGVSRSYAPCVRRVRKSFTCVKKDSSSCRTTASWTKRKRNKG
jgi:hypothetical protein